ncbi:energy-coupling factor ABC transporter ATP-binding protein [Zwartia panacis]|uniref:energy-coupling factor ABC transporter ATP-binding protein n=1 Tax=Zwartia panacis TaxID=2683345 RepID=UPI0025B3763B|nr:ABC transporter ATP-binding protein [Zwartia panacis]MDN4016668.1 ABC transporter ATP-binding protein [Zwartia panacis]
MLIEFKNIFVEREGRQTLADLSLSLSEHRIGIIGPNGSGKSTFIRLINGLLLPKTGQIRVDGLDTRHDVEKIRRKVGFVFQNPDNQIVFPMVSEDIEFGLKRRISDAVVRRQRMLEALAQLGVLHLQDRLIHTLSGGERQLIALAGVLATEPDILVFDEPTTQLDLSMRNRFEQHLRALAQPALIVSHDLDLMDTMERVLVLREGRLAFDGTARAATAWYRTHCG